MNEYIWKIKHFRWKHEYSVKIVLLILFFALYFLLYINVTSISLNFHNFNSLFKDDLQFYSFYVGQGESSLVISGDTAILYDTGTAEYAENLCDELDAILSANDISELDYLILSHPHTDHTGGAEKVLSRFKAKNIYRSKVLSPFEEYIDGYAVTSDLDYIDVIDAIYEENANIFFIEPCVVDIGDAIIQFWTPQDVTYSDENELSPIVTVEAFGKTIMLTGDATSDTEEDFLEVLGEEEIKVDILKVSHHGSDTASSSAFLEKIHPFLGVISAGIDNTYNFPAEEVVDRLYEAGVNEIFITKNQGTIGLSLLSSSYREANGFIFHDDALMLTLYFLLFFMIMAVKFPRKKRYCLNYKNILR